MAIKDIVRHGLSGTITQFLLEGWSIGRPPEPRRTATVTGSVPVHAVIGSVGND